MHKMNEKQLPEPITSRNQLYEQRKVKSVITFVHCFALTTVFAGLLVWIAGSMSPNCAMIMTQMGLKHSDTISDSNFPGLSNEMCPVSAKIVPDNYEVLKPTLDFILHNPEFRNLSAQKLSGAVQIATEIHDGWLDVDDDVHFGSFKVFQEYLAKTFPKVHSNLKVEKVNKYALVFTWQGSESDLKPLMLTAHQDVVPVEWETASSWTHEPYSGYYDGKFVWGRGSSDCKNLLIGLLETVELLLAENSFKPKRTLVLGFGYDEEADGSAARHINKFLLERYGEDSFYAVIDEGNAGVIEQDDLYIAAIATGEKGYVDNVINLHTPGGHSSIPPEHTAIGIISQLVTEIETTPFEPSLSNVNPFMGFLQCVATHSETLDKHFRSDILKANLDENANQRVIDKVVTNKGSKYLLQTSQATDIIFGGVKVNALPESVTVIVNSRISVDSSVTETVDKITKNMEKVAQKFDLGLVREGKTISEPTVNGYFNYTLMQSLGVAPISPWSGEVWDTLTGTLRHLYEDLAYPEKLQGKKIISTPGLSTGNTDTKSYWSLTRNIYRYEPSGIFTGDAAMGSGIHSVNERVEIEHHLNIIAFYYEYLRNVDGN